MRTYRYYNHQAVSVSDCSYALLACSRVKSKVPTVRGGTIGILDTTLEAGVIHIQPRFESHRLPIRPRTGRF
jgi:hypothetical protein